MKEIKDYQSLSHDNNSKQSIRMKKKTRVIVDSKGAFTLVQAEMNLNEYSVLKCALRRYANGYGLSLLKRLEKAEA